MSQLIFCYGCGAQIHVAAAACPKCGAPAKAFSPSTSQVQTATVFVVKNTLAWILAFAPLIGWFLEGVIAFAAHGEDDAVAVHAWGNNSFWYVTLALNIGLSLLDAAKLKQAGVDTKRFKGVVWIVPVYLFQRAKTLGQGKGYFVTWLICFGVTLLGGLGLESQT